MHREINQRAREETEGQEGKVVSSDLSYVKKQQNVAAQLFRKRARMILAHFYKRDFCEMIANLCKKKQSATHS